MSYNLIKYDNVRALHRPVDPTSDIFEFRAVKLNGTQFDDTNIATKSEISDLQSAYNALLLAFNDHEYQQGIEITDIRNSLSDLSAMISALGSEVNAINADKPLEQHIIATAGQTDFTASVIRWSSANADFDVEVFRNGQKLVQDVSGTNLKDFIKLGSNQIRLTSACVDGEQISLRMCRNTLNIIAKDFFRWDSNGISGRSVMLSQRYAIGTNKTSLFRNGILMVKSMLLGDVASRYEETTSLMMTVAERLLVDDVVTVYNRDESVARRDVDGITTTTISGLDSYSDNRLIAYRNGLVMTKSTASDISSAQKYTETSPTSITLALAGEADEVFSFQVLQNDPSVEDHIGFTGTAITLSGTYDTGADKLMIFRNGKLMIRGSSFGESVDQYFYNTSNSLTLVVAAELTDWFHIIY
jgi:hypothetical protein